MKSRIVDNNYPPLWHGDKFQEDCPLNSQQITRQAADVRKIARKSVISGEDKEIRLEACFSIPIAAMSHYR